MRFEDVKVGQRVMLKDEFAGIIRAKSKYSAEVFLFLADKPHAMLHSASSNDDEYGVSLEERKNRSFHITNTYAHEIKLLVDVITENNLEVW